MAEGFDARTLDCMYAWFDVKRTEIPVEIIASALRYAVQTTFN